jgi:siderophore synthetase component
MIDYKIERVLYRPAESLVSTCLVAKTQALLLKSNLLVLSAGHTLCSSMKSEKTVVSWMKRFDAVFLSPLLK